MSHDQVRSTTHRCGSTTKRWSWILFTTSAEMWCAPHEETKVFLNPPSHQIFFSRPVWLLARSTAAMPPTLSDTLAATTTTAMRRPSVSTTPKVLRPEIFLPASYPLVGLVTVDAPRTLRASMTPAEGSGSRPSDRRCAPDTSGIDDPGGRFRVTTLSFSHLVPKSLTHPLPHAVLRPTYVVAVDGVVSAGSWEAVPATDNPSPLRRRWRSRCRACPTWWGVPCDRSPSRWGSDRRSVPTPHRSSHPGWTARSSQWVCPWIPSLKSMGFDHPKENYSAAVLG